MAWEPTGDGTRVGLFLPVPTALASQFPSLAPEDESPPHVTLLIVGNVPVKREQEFLNVCSKVLNGEPGPIKAKLMDVSRFVNPEKGHTVYFSRVTFSRDMGELRDRLWIALEDSGFDVKDRFPLAYNPHVTLAYMDGIDGNAIYRGPVPKGEWTIQSVTAWGLSKPHDVLLGSFHRGGNPEQEILMRKWANVDAILRGEEV